MRLGRSIAAVILSAALYAPAQPPERPITFSADAAALQHPIELPADAVAAIAADKSEFPDGPPRDLGCKSHEKYPHRPAAQLLCTKLPLSHDSATSYLLVGIGSLRGAHIVPYWIVRRTARGYSVVFKARCDSLAVLSDRYKGYRELEATWIQQSGANKLTVRYRFDGKSYVKFSSQESHN